MTLIECINYCRAQPNYYCFRPTELVGTGLEGCFTVRKNKIEPALPNHVGILLGDWTLQSIAAYERELSEFENGN